MKYRLVLILLLGLNQLGFSQEVEIVTDWNQAAELAKDQSKQILIILTGSDWCTPCKKMDKKVINQLEFQEYAKERLVIFLIDKTKKVILDRDNPIHKDYKMFQEKYQTNALPSLILTDYEGNKIKVIEGKKYDLKNIMNQLQDS